MALEQLDGMANVSFTTVSTDALIADSAEWKTGTLTRTNADVVADTLRMGWGDTALSPGLHSRYTNTGGAPQDVSANGFTPDAYDNLATGQSFRGISRYEFNGASGDPLSLSAASYIDWGDQTAFEFGGTDFTIEVWYYRDTGVRSLSGTQNSSLHSKVHGDPVESQTRPWYLSRAGSDDNGSYREAEAYFRDSADNDYNQRQFSSNADRWNHHAIRYDVSATQADVVLNGTQQFSFGCPDDPWGTNGASLVVGCHSNACFAGSMANLRITKSYLSTSQLDYGTTGTANGYSLTFGGTRSWSSLEFAGVDIPAAVDGVDVDLESLDGGVSQDTLTVSLTDATTSYDISALADGDEIRADFTIDVLTNPTATPEITAPVEVTSS